MKALGTTVGLFLLVLSWAPCAFAQEASTAARTRAESLFQDARALMAEGNFEQACKAFEASQRLDPGAGTLLNLARCYEKLGRFASAWSTFSEAEAEAKRLGQDGRAKVAHEHAQRLAGLVPKVQVDVREADATTRVVLDGEPIEAALLELPFAIDPGDHQLRIEAEGRVPLDHAFTVPAPEPDRYASTMQLELGPLEEKAPAPVVVPRPPAEPSEPAEESQPAAEPATSEADSHRSSRAWNAIGWLSTIIGGAGTGVGAALVVTAYSNAADADCDAQQLCSAAGLRTRERAQKLLRAGYITGISGAALLGGGLFLILRNARDSRVEVTVGPSRAARAELALGFRGSF